MKNRFAMIGLPQTMVVDNARELPVARSTPGRTGRGVTLRFIRPGKPRPDERLKTRGLVS